MISNGEKFYCNWTAFKKFANAKGISLVLEDECLPWWICWKGGYAQAVEDKGGHGSDVKLEDK